VPKRRISGPRSSEVEIVSETGFTRPLKKPKQRRAFVPTAPAADDNDKAVIRLRRCETQKVVAIACEKYAPSLANKLEDRFVRGVERKGLTEQCHVVTELLQQIAEVVGNLMIQQKLHSEAGAIFRATSRSISPR